MSQQSSVEMMWDEIDNLFPYKDSVELQKFCALLDKYKAIHKFEMVCSQMDMFNHLNNLPYGLQYLEKRQSATDFSIQYYKERFEPDTLD